MAVEYYIIHSKVRESLQKECKKQKRYGGSSK